MVPQLAMRSRSGSARVWQASSWHAQTRSRCPVCPNRTGGSARRCICVTWLPTRTPDALLVSACDKIHNARSILADLSTEGAAVWDRFTVKDPRAQLWYYMSVRDILVRRLPGPLSAELSHIVDDLSAHVA